MTAPNSKAAILDTLLANARKLIGNAPSKEANKPGAKTSRKSATKSAPRKTRKSSKKVAKSKAAKPSAKTALDRAASALWKGEENLPLDSAPCASNKPAKKAKKPRKKASKPASAKPVRKRDIRTIGKAGEALIKKYEGCARLRKDGLVEAYPDPGTGGKPWTIGWGATGKGIGPGTVWTQKECDARLTRDLIRYARDVARALGDAPTSQAQFDAMVSFHYNTGAIGRATLTRKHKAGDFDGARKEFARWNKAGGRTLKGLVRRRAEEAKLYAKG
jgi:GH24 family phage-related lysozyme (muramidase)